MISTEGNTTPREPELEFAGHLSNRPALEPSASSDETELDDGAWLAARYRRLGEAFLDEVRGDFAVSVRDPGRGLSLAARDGLGNRYLSYRFERGSFAVARDDASLADASLDRSGLEPLRWAEYFGYEELSGPETFFRGVRAVLPGEMILAEPGTPKALRRRALRRPRPERRIACPTWETYVEGFAELLQRAVARSIAGRSRVAVWLSGGLDSSPLAALAARAGCAVDALVWKVSGAPGDETSYAADAARHAGATVHWIPCDDAFPYGDLARWPLHPSTPEQTAYRWFHQRSYERAAELGHDLVLIGFGGDQLYGNAKRWFWTLLAAQGVGVAIDRLRALAPSLGWWPTIRSQVLSPLLPKRRSLRREPVAYLTAEARRLLANRPRWPPDLERARRPRQAERLLALLDAHGANVERHYAGPFGIEARTPLRDPDLVEFMLAVPDHLLQQGEESRPVLRAASRGLLPESVRLRQGKAGFQAVLERGLAPENLRWASALLLDPEALWRGFVEESAVRRWLEGPLAGDWDRLGFLQCLNSELWRYRRAGGELAALARGRP